MKEFLVGLLVIVLMTVVSALWLVVWPLLLVLGMILRWMLSVFLALLVIWLIGKATLWFIGLIRRRD